MAHRHILSAFETVGRQGSSTKDGQDQWQHLALDADIDDLFIEDAAPDFKIKKRPQSTEPVPQDKYIGIRLAPFEGSAGIREQKIEYVGKKPTAPAPGSGDEDRTKAGAL